jgi:hypothetical protein
MKKMLWVVALSLCLSAVFAGIWACGKSPTRPEPFLLRSLQSTCLPGTDCSNPGSNPLQGTVRFAVVADTVVAYHDTVWYNYGTLVKFEFEQDGRHLDFIENDTSKIWYGCSCRFNLEVAVAGLEKGSYLARLWIGNRQTLIGEAEIVLPGK